jgi:hypothetical protein
MSLVRSTVQYALTSDRFALPVPTLHCGKNKRGFFFALRRDEYVLKTGHICAENLLRGGLPVSLDKDDRFPPPVFVHVNEKVGDKGETATPSKLPLINDEGAAPIV